jgi:formylglycine-generating enzyme required for sulfatase activity
VPSPYGAIQLIGNVKEWVSTELGPATKGGSFRESDAFLAAFSRDDRLDPELSSDAHGFRCAADAGVGT